MSTLDRNKPTRNDRLRLIASGLQKHFPNATLTLAGQTLTTSQLADRIQQDIAASDATAKARAAWFTQVQAERGTHTSLAPVLRSLRSLAVARSAILRMPPTCWPTSASRRERSPNGPPRRKPNRPTRLVRRAPRVTRWEPSKRKR